MTNPKFHPVTLLLLLHLGLNVHFADQRHIIQNGTHLRHTAMILDAFESQEATTGEQFDSWDDEQSADSSKTSNAFDIDGLKFYNIFATT